MGQVRDRMIAKDREARLPIVAELYRKGYSMERISEEVKRRLGLKTYAKSTVHRDVQILLKEWREERFEDMDEVLSLELARIDEAVRELWDEWEKSKKGYTTKTTTKRGNIEEVQRGGELSTIEEKEVKERGIGNTAYIAEIRQQLQERRKLLGLYPAEKREITGEISFASLLMESGVIDKNE